MKRFVLILLALLLLLAACGRTKPEPTTEPTTGAPFVPAEGESGEISWRTVDVNAAGGREINAWLAQQWEEYMQKEYPTRFQMGNKTLIARNDTLTLRDNKTVKDTVLLEKEYLGEETDPEMQREEAWKYPRLIHVLDDRYFVYCWGYWEGSGQPGIYDTKNMRTIPIEYGDGDWYTGEQLIFADTLYLSEGTYGPYYGPLRLMRVNLKDLDTLGAGEPLMAVDVLADIPGVEDVTDMNTRLVTPDERYFVLSDYDGVRVYDLQQKKLALELPVSISGFGEEESYWWPRSIVLRGGKAYWTNDQTGAAVKTLVEITLP